MERFWYYQGIVQPHKKERLLPQGTVELVIQVFSEQVGLPPKLFSRVQRFQQVLRIVHTGIEVDWAEIALNCGYFDQAHFIHDFRELSEINPTAYLSPKTEHLNHVPIQG